MLKIGVILMTFSAFSFGNWFTDLFDSTPTPTIKIPIDLSKKGTVIDTVFRVNYDESTRFSLDFECKDWKLDDGKDCREMRKFIGLNTYYNGKSVNTIDYVYAKIELGNIIDKNYDFDGTRVPLKVTLKKITDKNATTILDQTYNTKGMYSDGTREIIIKHLERGKYRLTIENLKGFKELANRPMKLRIQSTYRK